MNKQPIRRNPSTASSKRLRDKCDALWQEAIVHRDKRCLICSKTQNLCAHHIVNRNILSCRHDLDNGITVCRWECHQRIHDYPRWFELWLREFRLNSLRYYHEHRHVRMWEKPDYKATLSRLSEVKV